jgi:hypothetical protein
MNLLEAIKPYEKALNDFEKMKSLSDGVQAGKLVDIWDEFKNLPENALIIFGRSSMRQGKTDKSCGGCVNAALNSLVQWRSHVIKTDNPVFKGDADKPLMNKPKVTEVNINENTDYSTMKFPKLKQIASKLGCKFTPSTNKEELIRLINEKQI